MNKLVLSLCAAGYCPAARASGRPPGGAYRRTGRIKQGLYLKLHLRQSPVSEGDTVDVGVCDLLFSTMLFFETSSCT